MTEALDLGRLDWAIGQTADTIGVIDALVMKLIRYLNKRKLRKCARRIGDLEERARQLNERQRTVQEQLSALTLKVEKLRRERVRVRFGDVFTLFISYGIRRGITAIRREHYEALLAKFRERADELRARAIAVRERIAELENRLSAMQRQENPSLLARILRFLLVIKNIIMAVLNAVTGSILGVLSSVGALVRSSYA